MDGDVEDDLLITPVLRDAQIEHHVGAVQAVGDGAEIVGGGLAAHPRLDPQIQVLELGDAVGVEPGDADGHVDVGLGGLAHEGEEIIGRVPDLGGAGSVDGAGPAAEGRERRVVDAVHRIGADGGVARHQLVGLPVQHPARARQDDGPDLVLDLRGRGIDGQGADVAPVDREGAASGGEKAPRVADIEVDLIRRRVFRALDVDIERRRERFVVEQRPHVACVEEDAL